ncbi:uncharacterized protein KY384_000105 [Bacidia gigantensis]|uniref:uncharacterized protein n=1 Tax=Bacidia gigantensis TaxID=2732470 RepID=UPI001D03DA38|nr:uncharacterized protein KY384_000105 [Bacidia gigantensis]KAG8526112.1 hypothetical protein KY384_000105 [Bacidia gigantensis]
MQCSSRAVIPNVPGAGYRDLSIPTAINSLVQLCGDFSNGLGIFCYTDEGPLAVFTPLPALFDTAQHSYLRKSCATNCWCTRRRREDDVVRSSGVVIAPVGPGFYVQNANGFYLLDIDGDPGQSSVNNAAGGNDGGHASTDDDTAWEGSIQDDLGEVGGASDLTNSQPSWLSEGFGEPRGNPSYLSLSSIPSHLDDDQDDFGSIATTIDTESDGFASAIMNPTQDALYADPTWDEGVICSVDLFGNPSADDCRAAIESLDAALPHGLLEPRWYRNQQFAEQFVSSLEAPVIKLPWSKTVGKDFSFVEQLQNSIEEVSDSENFDYIEARANAINKKCVSGGGTGGWARAGTTKQAIAIYLFGPRSTMAERLNIDQTCGINYAGVTECQYESNDKENVNPSTPPAIPDPNAVAKPIASQCSGTCAGACGEGCQCAYADLDIFNQRHVASDIPFSATWGTFACQALTYAAVGASSYAKLGTACSSGRCLLEANGSVAVANASGTLPPLPDAYSSSPLTCACNCTYASHGCCFANPVYEDRFQKANVTILGPAGTCCDHKTGIWVPNGVVGQDLAKDPACVAAAGASSVVAVQSTSRSVSSTAVRVTGSAGTEMAPTTKQVSTQICLYQASKRPVAKSPFRVAKAMHKGLLHIRKARVMALPKDKHLRANPTLFSSASENHGVYGGYRDSLGTKSE